MSVEANKELIRRFYETIEQENYEALKDFCHKDFVFYPQIDTPFRGVEGLNLKRKTSMPFRALKCQLKQWLLKGIK
ncbi:nuclear transport factor 2 family protein [Alteribacillus bidgolensis]|uniref:SnoaL-like domain-containing protein n=1 Tax=Alteribacillus bidgolensis TaxID=930129 RepID=A0A1G8RV70_9BACI|nr:nuclear transport factor 2 family protein [Alteribacillus bidgolensis]SDJ20974.1 hypothetical protein SAMN05216352_1344 [Alteribacillus bidgolensis]